MSWRGLLALGLGLALAAVACTAIPIHIPAPAGTPDAGYAADGPMGGHPDAVEGRDGFWNYPDAGPAPVPDLDHYADSVFPGGDGLPQGDGLVDGGPTEGGPTEGGPTEGGPTEGGPTEGGPTEAAPPLDAGAPALDL